ncbi:MAG: hypothetical protein IJT27_05560 [Clostridia bacterium]|nr:hypothetical protein [Clostridia bacterium]
MKSIAIFEAVYMAIFCFFGSIFNLPDKRVQNLIEQNGGFIYGVCHPNENYEMLAEAGIEWVRFDIPYPYAQDGSVSRNYLDFKERAKGYTDRGFKVMAVTPYPKDYFNIGGFNPVENKEKTQEIAVFLYRDLKDVTSAFQITNEMGIDGFTKPLTLEQAAVFIGIQLEALDPVAEDFPIGYNSAGVNKDLHKLMKPYLQYCDYVGIDLYNGNQGNSKASAYADDVKALYRITRKPIIVQEFGFWSEGGPKTAEQKAEILGYYGYTSEAEAIADGMNFISKLPRQFQQRLRNGYPDDEAHWAEIVFSKEYQHFYGETAAKTMENIPHTPEGQAKYFRRVMGELKKLNCLAGMIIYCCQDMQICYVCGHTWCPFETKWGLFNLDGTPKPAYYAVKEFITETGS